jgi:glycosyltransferase involved in cell wall biosynthesis
VHHSCTRGHRAANRRNDGESRIPRGEFAPVAVVDVEASGPVPAIPPRDSSGRRYGRAHALVRLHGKPLGALDLDVGDDGVSAFECAAAIWKAFDRRINDHLRTDGSGEIVGLSANGLSADAPPQCLQRRESLLQDAPFASVIICTRNRHELIARTLRSLKLLAYPNFEVIVVDGSTTTATDDIVRAEFDDVKYLHVGNNGLCVARNAGIEAASGSIVAFTDDDVVVDRYWLVELAAALQSEERVACATGLVFPLELGTQAQLWFEESGAFTEGFERRVLDLAAPRERGSLLPYATGRIGAGASMAWWATSIGRLGGFDLGMDGLQGEENAAFFDALTNGYKIVYEPSALVFHDHRRTYAELRRQLYWHGIGLGVYLARCLAKQPHRIPDFVRLVPRGLFYGLSPKSMVNCKKSPGFPAELTRAKQLGTVLGPFAYVKGAVRARRSRGHERLQ